MATYRKIHTSFWQDPFVLSLTPEGKYFYLYLMTNSRTSMAGVYEMPFQVVCVETGYNRETVEKLIALFVESKKIMYDAETGEVLLTNWLKHNFSDSPKVLECISKDAENIKSAILYEYCMDTVGIHIHNKTKTKHKTKHKHNIAELFDCIFLESTQFVSAWGDWVADREDRKKPLTERASQQQAAFLQKYPVDTAIKIIKTSIGNGWTGLFPPKQGHRNDMIGAPIHLEGEDE